MAVSYDGGVVVAADSRTSSVSLIPLSNPYSFNFSSFGLKLTCLGKLYSR